MTETPLLPPPAPEPEPVPIAPAPRRRDAVPWLYGLGFLILAAAIVYLWQYPSASDQPAANASAIQAVGQHLDDIDARLARLEQRPAPDFGKVTADLGKFNGDLGKVNSRLDALEGRATDQTQLAARLDTLSGRIESLSGRDQTGLDATREQISAVATRVGAVEANASNTEAVTRRLNRIARLQEAALALQAGRALGDLTDAPDALTRYAHAPPPTEADLRLRFPQAERGALATQQPDEGGAPFLDRVWDRAQSLVTVRRGDTVVVGDPAAVILSRAQTALEAGDLAGAISAVESLKGQPQQAMAPWLSEAKALLGARAALAQLAAQA
jgi:hypothetical protein